MALERAIRITRIPFKHEYHRGIRYAHGSSAKLGESSAVLSGSMSWGRKAQCHRSCPLLSTCLGAGAHSALTFHLRSFLRTYNLSISSQSFLLFTLLIPHLLFEELSCALSSPFDFTINLCDCLSLHHGGRPRSPVLVPFTTWVPLQWQQARLETMAFG